MVARNNERDDHLSVFLTVSAKITFQHYMTFSQYVLFLLFLGDRSTMHFLLFNANSIAPTKKESFSIDSQHELPLLLQLDHEPSGFLGIPFFTSICVAILASNSLRLDSWITRPLRIRELLLLSKFLKLSGQFLDLKFQ